MDTAYVFDKPTVNLRFFTPWSIRSLMIVTIVVTISFEIHQDGNTYRIQRILRATSKKIDILPKCVHVFSTKNA